MNTAKSRNKKVQKIDFSKTFTQVFNKDVKIFNGKSLFVFLLVCGLGIFGCLMVYSASSYIAAYRYSNEYFYLTKQIVGVVLGIISMFVCSFINYEKLKKLKCTQQWQKLVTQFLKLAKLILFNKVNSC